MSRSLATPAAPQSPRFALGWAALTYAFGAMMLGYPALVGKFLVSPPSDQYVAGYALREFGAHALRTTGSFPLWNPYLFGGMPYIASMNGDIFYPTFLLRMILPTDVAMTWSFILHVFLAGFFTYLFLRAWGLGFAGSLTGGLAYMMGGPIAAYVSPGHDGKLYVSALLPLVLFLLVRGMRDGKQWSWGVLAFTIGLAVLSPHPQLLQYLLLCAGAFALYLAFAGAGKESLPTRTAVVRLALAAGSVAVGFLIGAVQYLPVLEYVPWSPRAGGLRGYDVATSFSFPPEEIINTYLPQFSGILDNYWGRNGIHFHSEYLGAAVLLLAGLGLATAAGSEKGRSFTRFWIGTGIIALLWSLGEFTPFYHLVYAIVPGTKFFRAPSTMMFVMAFAVAVLAALGAERVAAGKVTKRYAIGWLVGAGVVLLLGVTGALTNAAQALAMPGRADAAIDNGRQIAFGAIRSFAAVAIGAGLLLALVRGSLKPLAAAYALAGLVMVDLWSVEQMYWRFSAPASVLFASDAITDYINKQDQPVRVLALETAPGAAYHDPVLGRDGLMPHRIRTVLGYHGNELGRYDQLLGKEEGYRQIANPQAWRLLNLKYLITNSGSAAIPGSKQLLGPVRDAAGTENWLYELPGDAPYAWVTPAIMKGADEAVMATILDPRFDAGRLALFEPDAPVTAQQLAKMPEPSGVSVKVITYEPGHVAMELDKPAPAGSALIASENYYPGWSATVDGKPAAIGRADFVLMGVALPAGARKVELQFASPSFQKGKVITLIAIALALAAAAGGAVLERRNADG